jgi:hypothetical protein
MRLPIVGLLCLLAPSGLVLAAAQEVTPAIVATPKPEKVTAELSEDVRKRVDHELESERNEKVILVFDKSGTLRAKGTMKKSMALGALPHVAAREKFAAWFDIMQTSGKPIAPSFICKKPTPTPPNCMVCEDGTIICSKSSARNR